MTARVSSESNHVDMRRDEVVKVVEGNLSGGLSLADNHYPTARESNNGPNAVNNS
jgi:hypothetical protein